MTLEEKSQLRVLILSVGLFAVVGALFYALYSVVAEQPRFSRSPTKVTESDEGWHRNVFDPGMRVAPPDLISHPAPPTPVSTAPSSSPGFEDVVVSCEYPNFTSSNQLYEVFPSDESNAVVLPDGNRMKFSAVALFLPTDAEWEIGEKPGEIVPEWIDPRTGQVLVGDEIDETLREARSVPMSSPRLHFRVEVEGEAPMRWLIPAIHDARTRRSIGEVVPGASVHGDGFFSMDLATWHQTPIDIGIEFAFGEPAIEKLPIEKEAAIRFGDEAFVKVVEVFPNAYRFVRWKEEDTIFNVYQKPQRNRRTALAIQVWPPQQSTRIEFQPTPDEAPRRISALRGVGGLRWSDPDEEVSEVTVYRFPRVGRAVFRLPSIPRLREVDNLFEVPISKMHVKYGSDQIRYAAGAAEVKIDFPVSSRDFPASEFPLFLTDTTPEQIFANFEERKGIRLYFDGDTGTLTDRKPPGFFERIASWWRKYRSGLVP